MSVKSMHKALMEMAQNQMDEAATVTHKFYSIKHWKNGDSRFDQLDRHLGDHEYKHSSLGNISKTRPDHHIGIPTKATAAIRFMDKHAKGVNESVDEAATVTHKFYSIKHWKNGDPKFDQLDRHLGNHEYKHSSLGNIAKTRPDHHIGIPTKATSAIKFMDKHGKSVNESVERASWVPEAITDEDAANFMGAAAAAKKAGKSHFDFGGKKYKVTMKHDTAKKVAESVECPTCRDGECQCEQPVKEAADMDPKDHVKYNDEMEMYCVYNKAGKVVAKFKDQEDANKYAMKNHDDLMEAVKPTAQHGPDEKTTDTFDKQIGGGRSPREKEFVDMHNTEIALDIEKVTAQNKQSMEDALKQTPPRLGDQRKGDTSFVNPVKADIIDGITKALQQMKTNN